MDAIAELCATDALMIGILGTVVLTKLEQIHKYFEVVLKAFDRPRTLDGSEALAVDDNTVVIAGFDTLTTTSRLRNELLKIIKEPRLKAWHTVRMMAARFVLDNFKVGVGRQQTNGVFIPKSCSELFFASNELCWAQERSLS